ncbi:hypothetical protein IV102_12815 [bacterium]|nr:hypothetical protein [bacterium]
MKNTQAMLTTRCPNSDQFQLVKLQVSQSHELQIGSPKVSECSVLAEDAEQCGRCLHPQEISDSGPA